MNDEPSLDVTPPTKRMKITPPIHLLPNELLVKIIEKLPRTQWPALEMIDRKFRDSVFLAWGSIRMVDMERDFIYSGTEAIKDEEIDHDLQVVMESLRRQIAQKTESILKKLSERSPFITSVIGLSLPDDANLNTAAVQYLSEFEHMETIKFAMKYFPARTVSDCELGLTDDIPLISLVEFMESTHSRATLKEIDIERCRIPYGPIMVATFDRLRAAFVNDSNDPTRQLLRLESFSMGRVDRNRHIAPFSFLDSIDGSKMTKLSLGYLPIDPTALTTLIIGAPQLQRFDFAFLWSCRFYDNAAACQRLQPHKDLLAALASHQQLTSLGFNSIWYHYDCACHRFEAEFKTMLRTIAPQLGNFVFNPRSLPPAIRMGEIRDIIQYQMPQMKSITLGSRCADDPEDLRGIADGKKLEEIEIIPYCYSDNYMSTLHEVLSTIISKSPRLKRFNGINYWPAKRVAIALCKLNDLTDLRIRADQLTEENFVAFSQQVFAEKLEVLHVDSIGPGVEPGLIELIKKDPHLRVLEVDQNVTDRLLECLADSCPNLEKFSVLSADGITFEGIQMLVDRCPKLRWLHVEDRDPDFTSSLKYLNLDHYRKLELYE